MVGPQPQSPIAFCRALKPEHRCLFAARHLFSPLHQMTDRLYHAASLQFLMLTSYHCSDDMYQPNCPLEDSDCRFILFLWDYCWKATALFPKWHLLTLIFHHSPIYIPNMTVFLMIEVLLRVCSGWIFWIAAFSEFSILRWPTEWCFANTNWYRWPVVA